MCFINSTLDHVWNENTAFENSSREAASLPHAWDTAPGTGAFNLNSSGEVGVSTGGHEAQGGSAISLGPPT